MRQFSKLIFSRADYIRKINPCLFSKKHRSCITNSCISLLTEKINTLQQHNYAVAYYLLMLRSVYCHGINESQLQFKPIASLRNAFFLSSLSIPFHTSMRNYIPKGHSFIEKEGYLGRACRDLKTVFTTQR